MFPVHSFVQVLHARQGRDGGVRIGPIPPESLFEVIKRSRPMGAFAALIRQIEKVFHGVCAKALGLFQGDVVG